MNLTIASKLLPVIWRMCRRKPAFLSFNVTNRCNEACLMCAVWRETLPDMQLHEIEVILTDLRRFGIKVVEVSGGEPFLRADILALLTLLDSLGFLYTTTTNAAVLTPVHLEHLAGCRGLMQLAVSLDSLDRGTYCLLRGKDLLPQVLQKIDMIVAAKMPQPVKLNMALNRLNFHEVPAVLDYAKSRGLYLSVFPVSRGTGFLHRHDDTVFNSSMEELQGQAAAFREIARLRREGEPLWEHSRFYELAAEYVLGRHMEPCGAGSLFLDLHADGTLAACVDRPNFADLRSLSISEVLPCLAGEADAVLKCSRETPCCYTCTYNISLTARHLVTFVMEAARVMLTNRKYYRGKNRTLRKGQISG